MDDTRRRRPPPPDRLSDPAGRLPGADDAPERRRAPRHADPTLPSLLETDQSSRPVGRGRVLVADDDKVLRSLIRSALERAGYAVVEAPDGLAALDAIRIGGIDMALLDVQMPGADGVEVCTAIRREHDSLSLPVVIVTGLADRDARVWCKAVGADDFLTKPMDATELLIRVDTLMKLKRFHAKLQRQKEELEDRVAVRTLQLQRALEAAREAAETMATGTLTALTKLCAASEFRDLGAAQHVERVGRFAEWIGRVAGLDEALCQQIGVAAPLHDVGMVGVAEASLGAARALTPRERACMERHPTIGHWVLSSSGLPELQLAARVALSHHERWDGTGYPDRLAGEAIPIEARVVAMADALDALSSPRPWREAGSFESAVAHVIGGGGTAFDPLLVAALVRHTPLLADVHAGRPPAWSLAGGRRS